MGSNDFYDDDLIRQRDRVNRIKMGPGDEPAAAAREAAADDLSRPVADLNLTRMARHKQDVDTQAARAVQEIELLKKRQEQLELEKRDLEEFKRKSEEFERGKREIIANLRRSLATIDRDDIDAQRLQELLQTIRAKFKTILSDLEQIKEQAWPEGSVREELGRALGVIEDARMEYNKAIAKIEAIKSPKSLLPGEPAAPSPLLFEDSTPSLDLDRSFSHWFKMGLGLSAPLILALVVLFIVHAIMATLGMF